MTLEILKLVARFVDAESGRPLSDASLRVRFYDADLLNDDFLGESRLSADGAAQTMFVKSDFQSGFMGRLFQRLVEQKPDIFVEIVDERLGPVFRSPVKAEVDTRQIHDVTKETNLTIDLGTYRVRRGEGLADGPGGRGGLRPIT